MQYIKGLIIYVHIVKPKSNSTANRRFIDVTLALGI